MSNNACKGIFINFGLKFTKVMFSHFLRKRTDLLVLLMCVVL